MLAPLFRLQYKPSSVKAMCLQVLFFYPIVDHARVAPAHASMLIRVNLQEQVPVLISFGEFGNTWITVVNVGNGNAMRGQLTLLPHIILNGIGIAEQTVMDSGLVGRVRECREQALVLR